MARRRRRQGAATRGRATVATSRRRRRGQDGAARRPEPPKGTRASHEREGFFADLGLEDIIGAPAVVVARGLREIPSRRARRAADITEALGTSAGRAIRHPGATARGGLKTITGLPEAAEAYYQMRTGGKGWKHYGQGGMSNKEVAKVMGSAAWQDYKRRYGPDWEKHANEDPLSNLLDVTTIAGLGLRGAALTSAASRLGETTRGGRLAAALTQPRKVWAESSRGPRDRRSISYQPPTGENPIGVERGWSRSPLMRAAQEIGMDISEQFPHAPMVGMRSRATRAQSTRVRRNIERLFGKMRGVESLENLSDDELVRLWVGTQMGNTPDAHSPEVLRAVKEVLEREHAPEILGDDAEFMDFLREAKKAGFGPKFAKQLDGAIKLAEKVPHGQWPEKYERAIEAMQEMTRVSEEHLLDADGFTDIERQLRREDDRIANLTDPDEIAASQERIDTLLDEKEALKEKLGDIFDSRRSRFRDFIWDNMQVPTRLKDAHREHLLERGLTNPIIDDLFAVTDKMAIAQRPHNPASWWEERIGAPSDETAEAFMGRVDPQAAQYQLQQSRGGPGMRDTLDPGDAPERIYYSDLQRWTAEKMGHRVPAAEMRAALVKAIKPQEFRNAGLDLYFDQFAPGEFVYKNDFLEHLANKLNAYNLVEHYRSSGTPHFDTRWDTWERGALLSREGEPGEYRELTMTIPSDESVGYHGRGILHWGEEDVVFHIRFQVFEEGGKRKLLVEEIQSDWQADVRRAKKQGVAPDMPREERVARIRELESELSEEGARLSGMYNEMRDLERNAEDASIAGYDDESADLWERYDALAKEWANRRDANHEKTMELRQLGAAGFPESPLGERYWRAALRRVAREAVDENVDEVILTDPSVQAVRNAENPNELLEETADEWGYYPDAVEGITPRMVREDYEADPPEGPWERVYGEGFSEFMRKEYGADPQRVTGAYWGRYSTQFGQRSAVGQMPGIVIEVTDGFRQQARAAQALYQRSPNWNALPKGATEMLGDGRTALRMFETGDASTWIHELAHVGIHDLDAPQRKVIEEAFGGGKPIEEWIESQHENYARAFERYIRHGEAPTKSLEPVFRRLSQVIGGIWRVEGTRVAEVSPEAAEVFGQMLTPHIRADTPKTFIPHRVHLANLAGSRASKGIPRADRVIGDAVRSRTPLLRRNKLALVRSGSVNPDPRLLIEHMNRVVMLARANQLREMVVEIAEPIRPGEGFNPDTEYVIKPMGERADEEFYDALEASEDPNEIKARVSQFLDDNMGGEALWNEWNREYEAARRAGEKPPPPLYVVDKKTVDLLFKNVTGKTPGATTKAGKGTIGAVADAVLDSVRAALLYGNTGFYTANMLGNTGLLLLSDPRAARDLAWALNQARKAAVNEDKADPLFARAAVEMGRGPTGGGLSQHDPVLGYRAGGRELVRHPVESWKRRRPGGVGRAAEAVSSGYAGWGRRSGRVIDDTFRVAAWKQVARKRGYKNEEEMLGLLDQGIEDARGNMGRSDTKALRDLDDIRAEAEQLMLDFDSMTPFEKTWVTRLIFLYPFLKASAKWPAYYAGERPVTAGVVGQAGMIGQDFANEQMGEAELPEWMKGYARIGGGVLPIGSFAPQTSALETLQMLADINKAPTTLGQKGPFDLANPFWRMAILTAMGRNQFGRAVPRTEALKETLPLTGLQKQLLHLDEPSEVWEDQSLLATLLRSLRFVPTEVNEKKAREQRKKATKEERRG